MLLNDPKKDREHPELLAPYFHETRKVMLHLRDNIQRKFLVLLSMCLELPEEDLLETHKPGLSKAEYYRYVSVTSFWPFCSDLI
jgi:hypothetical protein